MCTVVSDWRPGAAVRLLALRDELTSRPFDTPDEWWSQQPGVIGGRDRLAGGSWCVTDVAAGVTALVLNRRERRTGTPSRGVLPLAAVRAGRDWTAEIDHHAMATFTLVLAGPEGVRTWTWDAHSLTERELAPGGHMITTDGIDTEDPKIVKFAPLLRPERWQESVESCEPSDDPAALVVRHEVPPDPAHGFPGGVYATVFGQLMTSTPGRLAIDWSRTPWVAGSWTSQVWPA